jgi:hypothetical protein
MSVLGNQTSANGKKFFFLTADGQLFNVSTLNATNISSASIATSTISATTVDVDGQVLTATPTELLLNGVPLATTSNLSSIADWALDPAISTVQMAGNNLIGAGSIQGTSVNASNAVFQNLVAINSIFVSSFTSTISTVTTRAEQGSFSSLMTGHLAAGICDLSDVSANVLFANAANVSTLWGQPSSFYFDPISTISSLTSDNIVCSSLTAASFVSTPDLEVSSINGHIFGENTVQISSIVSNQISSVFGDFTVNLVSTLQFNPSFDPSLDVNLGLGSLFGNIAGAATGALGVLVGGAALGTGIAALTQGRQTNYINSNAYELVNGTTQLQVSTLAGPVTSVYRFVNSVSPSTPGEEVFISTVTGTGTYIRSLSDPLNTVSSPNSTIQAFGQWVQLPDFPSPSTVSSFSQLNTSSLGTSTITFPNSTRLQPGPSFQGAAGVSTLEVFWSDASPPLDADLRVGGLVISGDDVGGINTSKDVLIQNANNGQRLLVFGAAPTAVSTIAFLSDIPVIPPTVSSFQTASVSSLSASSINGGIPYTTAFPQPLTSNPVFSTLTINANSPTPGAITFAYDFPFTFTQVTAGEIGIQEAQIKDADSNNTNAIISVQNIGGFARTADFGASRVIVGLQGAGSQNSPEPTLSEVGGLLDVEPGLRTNSLNASTLNFFGLSTVTLSTVGTAGTQSQPAGRLVMSGNDLDLGQQDIWCQQIRVGAGNPGGSAPSEVVFYNPNGTLVRSLGLGNNDLTIRVQSTINVGTNNGYILDTTYNPPFFSTIAGTSTALMAVFPSTTAGVFGASTLSFLPPNPAAAFFSRSTQTVAANTPLTLWHEVAGVSLGSAITQSTNTLVIGQAGVYDIETSIQFDKSGGGVTTADFWFRKNGVDIPDSASQITIQGNNNETLGNVSILESFAAGDKLEVVIASADNTLAATFFQSTVTTPYTRPAVPSIITNIKKLG